MFDELEMEILKTILNNKGYAIEFVADQNEKLFSADLWRFVKIIVDYIKVYKEIPSKKSIQERVSATNNKTFSEHVSKIFFELSDMEFDEKDFKPNIDKLKKRYSEKVIGELKSNLSEGGDLKKNIIDIQKSLNDIRDITSQKIYKQGDLKEYAAEFKNYYKAKTENKEFGNGILTGYDFIDRNTNGVKPGELMLFAGTTSSGKSMILMNAAVQMFMQTNTVDMDKYFHKGYNILYFSLEMSHADCAERILSRMSMSKQVHMRDAILDEEEKIRVGKSLKFVNAYDHYFEIIDIAKDATVSNIEKIFNEVSERKGAKPDVVIVDYLNLLSTEKDDEDGGDWLQQAKIAENLHSFSRTKEVALLSAIQINPRQGNAESAGEFSIKSVRRSTQILDNANFLCIIQQRKEEKNYPDMKINLAKNRRGSLAEANLIKKLECCAILDGFMEEENQSGNVGDISNKIQ